MRRNHLKIFEKLRNLRRIQRGRLSSLKTLEDFDIIREIGFCQERKTPITLKLLSLQDIGSAATVQRRLRRLKRLGLVVQERSRHDRRNVELKVSQEVRNVYRTKELLLRSS